MLREQGHACEAVKLQVYAIDARKKLLGEDHPYTFSAMADLAQTYQMLAKYTDAEKLQINIVDARTRHLGEEHPDTIAAMENLAQMYYNL